MRMPYASECRHLLILILLACALSFCPAQGAEPGSWWTGFTEGSFDGTVYAVGEFRGELIVGGNFVHAGGVEVHGIARWDGSRWHALGEGLGWATADERPDRIWAESVVAYQDALIVGGRFQTAGGVPATYVARWDGVSWSAMGLGVNGLVHTIHVHDDVLYIGGTFSRAGGRPAYRIARWQNEGWRTVGEGFDSSVQAISTYGGQLVVGGLFGGAPTGRDLHHVAIWDGQNWSSFGEDFEVDPDRGLPVGVLALTEHQGKLIAGGVFDRVGAVPLQNVAAWDGTQWGPISPYGKKEPSGLKKTFALRSFRGELVLGGDLTDPRGGTLRNIARWDGVDWQGFETGVDGWVQDLLVLGPYLFAVGAFETAGSTLSPRVARWDPLTVSVFELHLQAQRSSGDVQLRWNLDPAIGPLVLQIQRRPEHGPERTIAVVEATVGPGSFVDLDAPELRFWYRLRGQRPDGSTIESAWLRVDSAVGWALRRFELSPNPSVGPIRFSFNLTRTAPVELSVHDLRGRLVRTVWTGSGQAGEHERLWDGLDRQGRTVARGSYLVRIEVEGQVQTRKLQRLR